MARSKSPPERVLRIATSAELQPHARAFAGGHLNLLLLGGGPGVGKSQCVRDAVGGGACWSDGSASAFVVYLAAYEHRDRPVVLDDVDGLYRDRAGVRLLKAICQTDRE